MLPRAALPGRVLGLAHPPSSFDDGYGDDDSDSGNNNYNGYWPVFYDRGGGGPWPWTTRFGGDHDPRLGHGSGPSF